VDDAQRATDPRATKVKVENGPVTIEVEGDGTTQELLDQALSAYREVARLPPTLPPMPLPGSNVAQIERAGDQQIGFIAELP
jgi:hypothetical protein